jgi:hypothetical protein
MHALEKRDDDLAKIHEDVLKARLAPTKPRYLGTSFGEEVHTDVWGPSPTQSLGGRKYYVTFTDDYLHYTCMQLLRTKDEAFGAYKAFAA